MLALVYLANEEPREAASSCIACEKFLANVTIVAISCCVFFSFYFCRGTPHDMSVRIDDVLSGGEGKMTEAVSASRHNEAFFEKFWSSKKWAVEPNQVM